MQQVLPCADVSCGMELECDEQCIAVKMKKQQVDAAKIIANKSAQIKRDQVIMIQLKNKRFLFRVNSNIISANDTC